MTRRVPRRVRRSPHLVFYWRGDALVVRNYATRVAIRANPLVCALLDFCGEWRTAADIGRQLPFIPPGARRRLLRRLVARTVLQQSDRPPHPSERAMTALTSWNPEAGFFHTATKDVRFWSSAEAQRRARERAAKAPMPPPVKRYRGVTTIDLPKPRGGSAFAEVALARRTWRRFAAAPVSVDELATVLGIACGVQQWVAAAGGDTPLKSSPSGGARHPLETYVVVREVTGIAAGIYHYASDRHALSRLRGPVPIDRIRSYVPHSGYFAQASAMVIFTAVFERQLWRYPYSRAYRAALIEAGHVCQTFLLAATALGLAPFCLMGLADSVIERDLAIDGITESVLYAAGVGRRPRGVAWAPLPRGGLRARGNRWL